MNNLNNILDRFKGLPFEIKGIGSFVRLNGIEVVAIKECGEYIPISVSECNTGYLRTSGIKQFTQVELIDCLDNIYKVREELILVLCTDKYTIESLSNKILALLKDFKIVKIVTDRRTILQEEKIKENEYNLIKVVFSYEYDFINDCTDGELECIC